MEKLRARDYEGHKNNFYPNKSRQRRQQQHRCRRRYLCSMLQPASLNETGLGEKL